MARINFLKSYTEFEINIDIENFFEQYFPCCSKNLLNIKKVKDIILNDFPHRFTEYEIGTKIKRNRKTVQRLFISDFGIKYKQIMETLRIYAAIILLDNTNLDNSEIAFLLKYSDLSSLDRDFNKVIGITPSKARMELKDCRPILLFQRYYRYKNFNKNT